jgi:hypothetical protein
MRGRKVGGRRLGIGERGGERDIGVGSGNPRLLRGRLGKDMRLGRVSGMS